MKRKTVNEGYICDGEGWIVSNIISDLSEPSLWLHSCLPLALVTATTARMGKRKKEKRKLFFLFMIYRQKFGGSGCGGLMIKHFLVGSVVWPLFSVDSFYRPQ
jgi:hypothetical protein